MFFLGGNDMKKVKCIGCEKTVDEEELNEYDYCEGCRDNPLYEDDSYYDNEY